jgi:hypothetical protein
VTSAERSEILYVMLCYVLMMSGTIGKDNYLFLSKDPTILLECDLFLNSKIIELFLSKPL